MPKLLVPVPWPPVARMVTVPFNPAVMPPPEETKAPKFPDEPLPPETAVTDTFPPEEVIREPDPFTQMP